MIRTVVFIILGIAMLIISFPIAVFIWLFGKKGRFAPVPKAAVFCIRCMAEFLCRLAGCKVEFSGAENIPDGPAVFAGNHQGNFDALLVQYLFGGPKVTLAKIEASYVPIANLWMHMAHIIFVDRKNVKKASAAYKTSLEYLKRGFPVLFFPEGTRSRSHKMGPFKGGAFRAAISTEVPLVPFVIDGTYKVYEETGHIVGSKVVVKVLPPIQTHKDDDARKLQEKVKDLIQQELDVISGQN